MCASYCYQVHVCYSFHAVLDAFIETLYKRHETTRGTCWFEGKKLVLGSPSKRPPPEECLSKFVANVVEDPEEEESSISVEDFDPTNWNSSA